MKSFLFIGIILLAGLMAGVTLGLVNLLLVEPLIDSATNIENQNLINSGKSSDSPSFWANYYSYRAWQKGGEILAGAILGISYGSLFGIVFAVSKNTLPGNNIIKKSLVLGLVFWLVLYAVPFTKYPANPPSVGQSSTIEFRQDVYLMFVVISGFTALGFFWLYKKIQKKIILFAGYGGIMIITYMVMPENPDPIQMEFGLLAEFRAMSVIGMSVFWGALSVFLGILWEKTAMDKIFKS